MKTQIGDTTSLLLDNAIRYLNRSIESLENDEPEFAIVEFYTSIELFVKARLNVEHWSLVVRDSNQADRDKYVVGDCNSVGLSEANNRLHNVCRDSIGKSLYKSLDSLRQHRNRVVHFYHEAAHDEDAKNDVTAEMCRAWHPFYEMMTGKWSKKFEGLLDGVHDADFQLRQVRKYLEIRFSEVEQDLKNATDAGIFCLECPACEFQSLLHVGMYKEPVAAYSCQVCKFGDMAIEAACALPGCIGKVHLYRDSIGRCGSCNTEYTALEVAEMLQPETDRGGVRSPRPYCTRCDEIERAGPTIIFTGDHYTCCRCFEYIDIDDIQQCDHCGTLQTDLPEISGYAGCDFCLGR